MYSQFKLRESKGQSNPVKRGRKKKAPHLLIKTKEHNRKLVKEKKILMLAAGRACGQHTDDASVSLDVNNSVVQRQLMTDFEQQ